jgi:hypothetical protein
MHLSFIVYLDLHIYSGDAVCRGEGLYGSMHRSDAWTTYSNLRNHVQLFLSLLFCKVEGEFSR